MKKKLKSKSKTKPKTKKFVGSGQPRTSKKKAVAKPKKKTLRTISKTAKPRKKKLSAATFEALPKAAQETSFQPQISVATQEQTAYQPQFASQEYNLPTRYGDNCIVALPRDPWWIYCYWDITEAKINEVINIIPVYERENLRWILRVYDVTDINFEGNNAHTYFDIDVNFEVNNWYVNVNQPERSWCIEIGLKNPMGKFFMVARSNIIATPYFGVSSIIDEEWAIADEDYYKILGGEKAYDGKSSLAITRKVEEIISKQISSPLASWGGSGFIGKKPQDKFFLEVATELIVYGRTEPDASVTVEGKKIRLRPDGTFSMRYALNPGDYKFEVIGTSNSKKYKIKKTPTVKRSEK